MNIAVMVLLTALIFAEKSFLIGGAHRPIRSLGPDPLLHVRDRRARCAPAEWCRHVM
jgi:hypothetical protein